MRRKLAISIGLVLLTLAAYWQVGRADFVTLDDSRYVSNNLHVEHGLTWAGVRWAFTTGYGANWHPLTWLSHMGDVELFDMRPAGPHVVNLLLHVGSAVTLFLVLAAMTGAVWRSALVAALFAVHPLHVESVAWVSERKDVLSTFLGLLALAAYVGYARRGGFLRYLLVFLLLALGLLAKPMLVTLPFVFLLLDYWPLGRWTAGPKAGPGFPWRTARWLVIEKLPLLLLSAASSVVTYMVQQRGMAVIPFERLPLGLRIENALVSCVVYLGNTFWPLDLAVLYPYHKDLSVGAVLLAAGVLAACSAVALWGAWQGRRWLAVGWAWYLGMLVPVIGLVQVGLQSRADRYTYLPLVGVFLVVVWGAAELAARWRLRATTAALAAAVVLAACTALGARQVGYWANSETLFRRALAVRATEDNVGPYNALAVFLFDNGRTREAKRYWDEALKINPNDSEALTGRANLLKLDKRYDDAARLAEQALRMNPASNPASGATHNTLAAVRMAQGRTEEALEHLQEAHRLDPENLVVLSNLAKLYLLQEKLDLAADCWQEILRLKPEDSAARDGLADVRMRQGRLEEAAEQFGKLIQLQPENTVARNNLATVLAMQGKYREAVAQWTAMLQMNPHDSKAMNSLALVLSTCPDASIRDGTKAVALAEQVCKLSGRRDPAVLYTLAAAYAEAGQFPKAVATAAEALALAERQDMKPLAAALRDCLELYRKNSPLPAATPRPGVGPVP
jgi:tetratricopeptide (TPR) repeat protein